MSEKKIFAIDIDDGAFKDFAEAFNKFKQQVSEQPGAWAEVASWAKQTRSEFEKMNKAALATDARQKKEAQAKISSASDAAAFSWGAVTRNSKLFFENIKGSTFSLLKWSGLTAAFSGLLSAGGLFGIERMAGRVSQRRTSAAGLGVSYGERQSFLTNFGRLGNAEGLLGGFNRALVGTENRAPLAALLGGNVSQTHNASDAFATALPKIKSILDKADPRTLTDMLRARQWDKLGIDANTAQIIQGMKPEEIQDMIKNYRKNSSPMGMDAQTARNWQDFNTQLDLAGKEMETHFAIGLSNLTPGLTRLTDALTNLFDVLLRENGPAARWLKKINKGVENFADNISSKKFEDDVNSFLTVVSNFIKVVAKSSNFSGSNPNASLFGGEPEDAGNRRRNRQINYWLHGHKDAPSVRDAARRGHGRMPSQSNDPGNAVRAPTGITAPGLRDLENDTTNIPGGRKRISAENDAFHQRLPYPSAHAAGLAFDQPLQDPSQHAAAAEHMRRQLEKAGLSPRDYRVIDEYAHPSPFSTGGHIHTQFNSREAAKRYHDFYEKNHPQLQGGGNKAVTVEQNDNGNTHVEERTQTRGAEPQSQSPPQQNNSIIGRAIRLFQ